MIPRRSGDRQKNDMRDASALAVLHRGGLLTAVWVPDPAHEAMRDPRIKPKDKSDPRAAGGGASSTPATERVPAAPRADLPSEGRRAWTKAHRSWLADQSFT
jgi:transposase